jgi:hypothetical protein
MQVILLSIMQRLRFQQFLALRMETTQVFGVKLALVGPLSMEREQEQAMAMPGRLKLLMRLTPSLLCTVVR